MWHHRLQPDLVHICICDMLACCIMFTYWHWIDFSFVGWLIVPAQFLFQDRCDTITLLLHLCLFICPTFTFHPFMERKTWRSPRHDWPPSELWKFRSGRRENFRVKWEQMPPKIKIYRTKLKFTPIRVKVAMMRLIVARCPRVLIRSEIDCSEVMKSMETSHLPGWEPCVTTS